MMLGKYKFSSLLCIVLLSLMVIMTHYATAEDIVEIQRSIKETGAEWTAGETSVSDLTLEEKKQMLGDLGAVSQEMRSQAVPGEPDLTLPDHFDWRNVSGENYVTSIKNQGSCGSCWAFSVSAGLESLMLIHGEDIDPGYLNLSEQFLVSCVSGNLGCDGGWMSTTCNFLVDTGITKESCFGYSAADLPCENRCANWEDQVVKLTGWSYISRLAPVNIGAIQTAIVENGPVPCGFTVFDDFYSYTGGIYSHTTGSSIGGHQVLIVGYDTTDRYWIVKNSWGTGWGESGYFKISWDDEYCNFGRDSVYFEGFTFSKPGDPGDNPCAFASINSDRYAIEEGHKLRDEVLDKTEIGQQLIDAYYQHTAEITHILLRNRFLMLRGAFILRDLRPGIRYLAGYRWGRNIYMTRFRVAIIQRFLNDVGEKGSLELAITMSALSDILEENKGKRISDVWEDINNNP
ncbi:hypothetical protein GF312_17405 [Candidatus Poribacteria bacterium]|nr:hypothetical protein [Candidatus Poribacteria bacterium]